MIALSKKGDLKRVLMVLVVGLLLFSIVTGIFSFAETPEEEKARLGAELAQLEAELSVIDGGKWVNISTSSDPCQVSLIKFFNYNCDNSIGYHTVCISNISYYVSNNCLMPDEAVKIKLRIEGIKERLRVLEDSE